MNLDKAKYIANKVMNLFREEGLTNEDVGVTLFLLTLKCAAAKQEAAQDSMSAPVIKCQKTPRKKCN